MPEIFRSPLAADKETEALVVHCSAARMQPQFHRFLQDGLQLGRYTLIVIPGGIQSLTTLHYLPKFGWAGWRWMKFLVDLEEPPRVVLIGHDDCNWYKKVCWLNRPAALRERILTDLRQARAAVCERFPKARVDAYFARLEGDTVVFETV